MSLIFNDDFGFSVDNEFAKSSSLLCDVLLSSSDISNVLRDSSIESFEQNSSPGIESLEFCVPGDDGTPMDESGGQPGSCATNYDDDCDSPTQSTNGASCGPISAPLQSFPSVDVGYLRRRCKAEGARSPLPTGGRRRAESDPIVPIRQSSRTDTRKRRMDDQGRRTAMMELSEEERLEKNRQSARDCRLRKKRYIENLERRISEYEKREIVLTSTIARLDWLAALAPSLSMVNADAQRATGQLACNL